jgi:PAS domain S-box-containing protein
MSGNDLSVLKERWAALLRQTGVELEIFMRIMETSAMGLRIADLEGHAFFVNPALCRILGEHNPEDVYQRDIFDYYAPETAKRVREQILPLVLRQGQWFGELTITDTQGRTIPVMENIFLLRDDTTKPRCIATVVTDISERIHMQQELYTYREHLERLVAERTAELEKSNARLHEQIEERKRAEEALIESQQKYQGLVETLYDWVWEVDRHGQYTYVSPQIKNILGYEARDILGKTPFDLMPPEEVKRVSATFAMSVKERKPIVALENINFHKDGRLVVLETNGLPFYDVNGNYKGYRGTDRDITERKQAEKALRTERNNLVERVKELNCLYVLSELTDKPAISIDGVFRDIANHLPPAWQYPDITHARIIFEEREYTSKGFEKGKWRQSADIRVHGTKLGIVEVFYLKEMPELDEGPFLKEERKLVNEIAKRLGRFIERKRAEEALMGSNALLKSVIESSKDIVIFALDRQYRYLSFNDNHYRTMKRIWGVDIELGQIILEYIKSPEDCLKAKNSFDRALTGEFFTIVEEYGDTALERRYYEDIYNPIRDGDGYVIGLTLFLTDITERRLAALEKERLITELQHALAEVKTLSGMLPICANCKKIRDDKGYWNQLESYLSVHTDALFSHSICPECMQKLYPDYTNHNK